MQRLTYHIFPSGLRLVHRQTDSPVAYLGIMVGAGTRDEMPDEMGMAHYVEHCVFKGTERLTSRQIINRIETVGGEINAYTTKEETTYYAAVPTEHSSRVMALLSEMILHPSFPKEETDKERRVIYDEIESYNDSPSELIYDDFEALVFAGHALAHPILGEKKTLRRFTAARTHAFMNRTYVPARMVVFVESSWPVAKVIKMVEREVEQQLVLRSSALPLVRSSVGPAPMGADGHEATFHRHTHQTHVMLGGRAFPLGHDKQLGMYLICNILGGGSMSSRLNMSLREQKGLVYTVESIYTPLSDTGYWSVYFASDPENRLACIDLVRKELSRLCEQPLSDTALRRAHRQLHGQMAIAAENRENSVLSMAKQVLYYGYSPTWQESFDRITAYSSADLCAIAEEMFAEDNLFVLQYL